jgi:hypothetical protein
VVSVVEIIRITVATGSIERILFDFTGRLQAAVRSGQIALADSINKGVDRSAPDIRLTPCKGLA